MSEDGFVITDLRGDEDLERDGVWIACSEGFEVLVASLDNTKYQEELRRLLDPNRAAIARADMTVDLAVDATYRAMSKFIVLGWKKLQERKKDKSLVDVPYSVEKAYEYLSNYTKFFSLIQALAGDVENFRKKNDEEAEGNSEGT